jgi:hypothetical protein
MQSRLRRQAQRRFFCLGPRPYRWGRRSPEPFRGSPTHTTAWLCELLPQARRSRIVPLDVGRADVGTRFSALTASMSRGGQTSQPSRSAGASILLRGPAYTTGPGRAPAALRAGRSRSGTRRRSRRRSPPRPLRAARRGGPFGARARARPRSGTGARAGGGRRRPAPGADVEARAPRRHAGLAGGWGARRRIGDARGQGPLVAQ